VGFRQSKAPLNLVLVTSWTLALPRAPIESQAPIEESYARPWTKVQLTKNLEDAEIWIKIALCSDHEAQNNGVVHTPKAREELTKKRVIRKRKY